MKTYRFTLRNKHQWAITDDEVIVIAKDMNEAKSLLVGSGFSDYDVQIGELVLLKPGVHLIIEKSDM
jgi:hypothetical protein